MGHPTDLSLLHTRAKQLATEIDGEIAANDRLRLKLGLPPPGMHALNVLASVLVVLGILGVVFVTVSVIAHQKQQAAMIEAAGPL